MAAGVHRVKSKGREYHYAWRGGPRFWVSGGPVAKHSAEYFAAFAEAGKARRPRGDTFKTLVNRYIQSTDFTKLAPRTREDYLRHLDTILTEFGDAPIQAFNDQRIRDEVLTWRDAIKSDRQADMAIGVLARVVSWAHRRGLLQHHRLQNTGRRHQVDRSRIIWTPAEREAFTVHAPALLSRALEGIMESGLRPGDLVRFDVERHVQKTPAGRIIDIPTGKSRGRRHARPPVTRRMAELIDATPAGQGLFLLNSRGNPWTVRVLSKAIRKAATEAGIREGLHFHDARGYAATRFLIEFKASLAEIADVMGWSPPYAATMVRVYADLDHAASRDLLARINAVSG